MKRTDPELCYAGQLTGMAEAVMREIATRLGCLADTGESAVIDLRSLPLTDADRVQLETVLGSGEVEAELRVLGQSSIRETGFPGVWWIRHRGGDQRVAAEEIAVTRIPEILITHVDDIRTAAGRLRQHLAAAGPGQDTEEACHG